MAKDNESRSPEPPEAREVAEVRPERSPDKVPGELSGSQDARYQVARLADPGGTIARRMQKAVEGTPTSERVEMPVSRPQETPNVDAGGTLPAFLLAATMVGMAGKRLAGRSGEQGGGGPSDGAGRADGGGSDGGSADGGSSGHQP
ncbi:hypothetical protein HPO96_05650 [Kribbella sandramycini]|uniref:Putative membrane protein YgcG n=1 Tax=Kribbella sandramycini TaxID=60450 RepID=A0A7Y4NZ83_9ACTN|nr:hypothetical protein [Kribbella sandramycini]MBB6567675.1 putative membrane protein YgcG [Kribbella sandramycini]NOL39724.1 hypothetical protein [Kribbella sandramycini]